MKPPKTFTTPRLHLRPLTLDDAEPLFQDFARDPEVSKYMTWRPHETREATRQFIQRCINCWHDGSAFSWAILRQEDETLLGLIEIRIDRFRADFGYGIGRAYWGQGYTSEAASAVVQWAMAQEEIYRVWAICDLDNPASARVMEKAGLQREGILRRHILHPNISSEPRDCFIYAIVK